MALALVRHKTTPMANEQSNELHGEKDDGRGSSSVAVKLNLGNDIEEETTTAWLRRSFGPIGAYGGIKKEFFITAVREIEVTF